MLRNTAVPFGIPALSPFCEGIPAVTRHEITQAIQKLTEDIRTLSYFQYQGRGGEDPPLTTAAPGTPCPDRGGGALRHHGG